MRSLVQLAGALAVAAAMAGDLRPAGEPPGMASAAGVAVVFVAGAPGAPEYASNLVQQAALWSEACQRAGASLLSLGPSTDPATNDLDRLVGLLRDLPKEALEPLWLVLAGHGTFDGREARFNLRGPDLTPAALAAELEPFRRPLVLINTASASAPFLNRLAGTNRVVITATRSGDEQNYARFGDHFAAVIADPAADRDSDGQTSLLEAFLTASTRVAEFYQSEGRLLTEHALIEDTGDGLGTPADWFRGVRPVRRAADKALPDGTRAHQIHLVPNPAERALAPETRARRDTLELAIARLREGRSDPPTAPYLDELERLLIELARLLESGPSATP